MKLRQNSKGFTLVEVIIVLVIIAIMAVMLVPSLTGYISKAKRSAVLSECKMAAAAAQTLYADYFADTVTISEIKSVADVPGEIHDVSASDHKLIHLSYTNSGLTCTYCRNYLTCDAHDMLFSFSDSIGGETGGGGEGGNGGGDGGEGGGGSSSSPDHFVAGGDPAYTFDTIGDLNIYIEENSGNTGGVNINQKIVYWNGEYYVARYNGWYSTPEQIANNISTGSLVKINNVIKEPVFGISIRGDIKLENGVVKIFLPNNTSYGNWEFNNNWYPLTDFE